MGKLLLNRETGGYGLVTALCFWSNAPWLALVYKSTGFTAGASMAGKLIWSARLGIHPHTVKISAPPPLACDRSGGGCGWWCPEETADFQQLPGAHPRHQASRQSWSVAIRNFLTSPFPFDCSGLLGSGKCCSVIISCGCGCRPVWCARIGAKSFFPVDERGPSEPARHNLRCARQPCYLVLLGATWALREATAGYGHPSCKEPNWLSFFGY